ncbi:MAG: FAD-dependent oxidoreductase [Kiritimatiellaeota bacterium]|nr:FAD-dependent oxidoreductase [Kiritimatiellota bacterium]
MGPLHTSFPIDVEETVDLLVVGGGIAGVCAAIAAARNGCETALVEMDQVLGGNSSPLLGVHVSGAHSFHPYASETGIIEELELEAARQRAKTRTWGHHYNISHQWELVLERGLRDAGVRIHRRHQARRALTEGRRMVGAVVLDNEHFLTRLFRVRHGVIDASGDGAVARDAGASFMRGTESRERFGERSGAKRDSADTMGTSITALVRKCNRPVEFVMPPRFAARAAAEGPPEKLAGAASWNADAECCFLWVTETGGNRDTLLEAAEIRDELLYQLYRTWDNIKNRSFPEKARNWELLWVSPKSGKRESRRFIGDYVLTQTDVESGRPFPDSIGYGGYGVDIHEPRTGAEIVFHSIPPLWSFPYRCCYSRDFDNLWLAGRLMSVSHLALGTVRLMRTLGAIGQGVGTAAALARKLDCTAAEIGRHHNQSLQQTLLRQDATILTATNRDPNDLARTATVNATSEMRYGAGRIAGYLPLDLARGVQLWDWAPALESAEFAIRNRANASRTLRLQCELFEGPKPWKAPEERVGFRHLGRIGSAGNRMEWGSDNTLAKFAPIAESAVTVPARFEGWIRFDFPKTIPLPAVDPTSDENRINLVLASCPDIELGVDPHFYDFALRLWAPPDSDAYEVTADCHAFRVTPAPPYGEAANIVDGHNRRYSTNPVHAWLSDFDRELPQAVTLTFPEPVTAGRVHLTFDTIERAYRDAPINCGERFARRCVTDYRVEVKDPTGSWHEVVRVRDNVQRFRVHTWTPCGAAALRLVVEGVRDPRWRARIYEVRVYAQ